MNQGEMIICHVHLLLSPALQGTDVGVLYFETSGWLPMCGHDTIGLSVALIETGMVTVTEPITTINLDTAAGVIKIEAKVENGSVKEVSFANAPAFVLRGKSHRRNERLR